jgi:hypothetical protein
MGLISSEGSDLIDIHLRIIWCGPVRLTEYSTVETV